MTTKFDQVDDAIEQLMYSVTLSHKEAGAIYSLVKTFEGHTAFDRATLTAIVDKLKAAQEVAIKQQVEAEFASGRPT